MRSEKEIKEKIKKTKKQFKHDSNVPFFKGKDYVKACTDLKLAIYEWCLKGEPRYSLREWYKIAKRKNLEVEIRHKKGFYCRR